MEKHCGKVRESMSYHRIIPSQRRSQMCLPTIGRRKQSADPQTDVTLPSGYGKELSECMSELIIKWVNPSNDHTIAVRGPQEFTFRVVL